MPKAQRGTADSAAGSPAKRPNSTAKGRSSSQALSNAPNTHIAGEMFVAAELAKRGYLVSLTMGNAKAVDLFVEKGGRSHCIQVKAIARKRYVGWPLPSDRTKIVDGVTYVCVILNEIDEPPTYFALSPKEVLKLGSWYGTRAILNVRKVPKHEGAWDLIAEELGRAAAAR